jgi:hypothetical protein
MPMRPRAAVELADRDLTLLVYKLEVDWLLTSRAAVLAAEHTRWYEAEIINVFVDRWSVPRATSSLGLREPVLCLRDVPME